MLNLYEKENVTCVEAIIENSKVRVGRVFLFLVNGMLIDTGTQSIKAALLDFFKENSFDFVTLTHSHEDHSGLAPWIQANWDIPIYVHEKGIPICEQSSPYPKYRQIAWGRRDAFKALPLGDTIQSRNHNWDVIYTPGHAEDHVSLLHKETGRLFTGDLFVSTKTKVMMESESIPVIMNSIRKLLHYDFQSIFCSHSGYFKNGKELLKEKLDYLENVSEQVKELYKSGLSVYEIKQKFFPKPYPIIKISGGEWDSLHVISSILSE
ncbi:Glyoxylase, beta-lactamase superfamily II [Salinibacillus kushneri]|uniref:Glyoxylase, beta-lactamase superfamily II n=1 Tax=Salinibacillus kushneri TaxID=237682 RepID=A0A1I0F2R3_9BACI|nr:MBL fold metallo-hydrolase [Salinibacillus kushneri]SET52176.1 Glyoxylase, beta-lactamase superfamily II [Salinibacillus kushneri]